LCPNCDSQTITFCRGKKQYIEKRTEWWKNLSLSDGKLPEEIYYQKDPNSVTDVDLFTSRVIKNKVVQKDSNDLDKRCICSSCGTQICNHTKTGVCEKCCQIVKRKVKRPSREELLKLVWNMSTIAVAKQFGVSDVAIAKWCKSYEINKPPRGYWAKQKHLKTPTVV
jgi:hypothetical protein